MDSPKQQYTILKRTGSKLFSTTTTSTSTNNNNDNGDNNDNWNNITGGSLFYTSIINENIGSFQIISTNNLYLVFYTS